MNKKDVADDPNMCFSLGQEEVNDLRSLFKYVDSDGDGFISMDDLTTTFNDLGQPMSKEAIRKMIGEGGNLEKVSFPIFLTLFAKKFAEFDPIETMTDAFKVFDTNGTGFVDVKDLCVALTTYGDVLTKEEVDDFLGKADIVAGQIDYVKFIAKILPGVGSGNHTMNDKNMS